MLHKTTNSYYMLVNITLETKPLYTHLVEYFKKRPGVPEVEYILYSLKVYPHQKTLFDFIYIYLE